MSSDLSRRDFLKSLSLLGVGGFPFTKSWQPGQIVQSDLPNILIVVFDTLSAKHMSTYGYPRETTPHLNTFAERAHVYHNHYSAAPYTTPATASLLTGTYPWKHRAFDLGDRTHPKFNDQNLFSLFKTAGYNQTAYTHNPLADIFLQQFNQGLDEHIHLTQLMISDDVFFARLFGHDLINAQKAKQFLLLQGRETFTSSLLYSTLFLPAFEERILRVKREFADQFPLGLPRMFAGNFLVMEDVVDWIVQHSSTWQGPHLSYYHLLPPHDPYKPTREDFELFAGDGFEAPDLLEHRFSDHVEKAELKRLRREYDEFIRYIDRQFADLIQRLEGQGTLDNTIVILTSDHGELFERGIWRHLNPALLEGVLRIPLMIAMPGQEERVDIYERTNSVDVLPTLLSFTNQAIPNDLDGVLLPPFNDVPPNPERAIFSMVNFDAPQFQPLEHGSFSILQGNHRLIQYLGYQDWIGTNEWHEVYSISEQNEVEQAFDPDNESHVQLVKRLTEEINRVNHAGYHTR
jgi:arylsulfatase A-like enzyme